MASKKINIVIQFILFWIGLTFFFTLVNNNFEKYPIIIQSINALLFTVGYFFSYYKLIIPFLYEGKTSRFIVSYVLTILILSAISMISVYQVYVVEGNKFYTETYWKEPVFYSSVFVLILLSTSTLLSFRVLRDKLTTQNLLERVEKEKVSNELNFLKAQINPHFLFNSLNNILFQIDKSNTNARETLLKFSDMLRYQLYECGSDVIEIEKEIQYIRNYIQIQMLRKNDKYDCRLSVSESVKGFSIAPLILIPFIENAFKHVSNYSSQNNLIEINIDYRDKRFIFDIINDKEDRLTIEVDENKGIGLMNVKRRLDLLYPASHVLKVINSNEKFKVHLGITVNSSIT